MDAILSNAQSLTVLLQDVDTRRAILEYLQAETDKVKPKVEWREVWRQESDVRSHVLEYDPYTSTKDKRVLVQARMRVKYHEGVGSADAIAFLAPPGEHVWFPDDYWSGRRDPLLHESRACTTYTEAILWGQSLWAEVVQRFEAVTEPPSEALP